MSIDFLNTAFSEGDHLLLDNDGVQSEFTENPNNTQPNDEVISAIRTWLSLSERNLYSVLSGRLTTFLADRKAFADIISDFPLQACLNGLYGNQRYDANHTHVIFDSLKLYETYMTQLRQDIESWLVVLLDDINSQIENDISPIHPQELCELIVEDKIYSIGLHQRQLLSRMGLSHIEEGDSRNVKQAFVIDLLSRFLEKCLIFWRMRYPGLKLKIQHGKLVEEIFPAEDVPNDKVDCFIRIYDKHSAEGDCDAMYFFGDDLGDYRVYKFCENNRNNLNGPKTYFIFIDSVTKSNSIDPNLVEMKANADFVVTSENGLSAIENLAHILKHKISLGVSRPISGKR